MMHCTRFFGGAAFSFPEDVKIKVVIALKLFVIYYGLTRKCIQNRFVYTGIKGTSAKFQFIVYNVYTINGCDNDTRDFMAIIFCAFKAK